ncbi:sel1 repeat family protein, partial [Paraburkholderia aspalathi]|nr:sel1 repeat family protein [Paraburkholderia aspalathi]
AFPWFEKAAEAKLADGEYALSQIYANGTEKLARDDVKARDYLERAAQKGYDTAQLDLATWLIEGRGGKRDYETGFKWMQRAARSGNVAAQARLARLYRDGIGTDGDSVQAAAWYIVARRAGLATMDLDSMMDGLADDQIKQAMMLANRLRAAPQSRPILSTTPTSTPVPVPAQSEPQPEPESEPQSKTLVQPDTSQVPAPLPDPAP